MAAVAFVLWEFPGMVVMSLHKAACALRGRGLAGDFLGIWPYRLIGVLVLWPLMFLLIVTALSGGFLGAIGTVLFAFEVLAVTVLLIWARVSHRGA